jgi:hypothetical protein
MARIARERPSLRRASLRAGAVGAAAAAVVVLAASLPGSDTPPGSVAASEISRRVRAAARALSGLEASFEITERGWHPRVGARRFTATIAYEAPERFRLMVRDHTRYPSPRKWPQNDVDLVASARRWWIREPSTCPPEAMPGCAVAAGTEERSIIARQPFDGSTSLPTDIVVPLETLATSSAFEVLGADTLLGRRVVRVRVPFRQAAPLVMSLQPGGSWAELRPADVVDIWIEPTTWFPLRFEVRRTGRARPLLEVRATSFEERPTLGDRPFRVPRHGVAKDGAFHRGGGWDGAAAPAYTAGLRPYRAGAAHGHRILAYVDGMAWLKVVIRRGGNLRASRHLAAEEVALGAAGFGYYEPATESSLVASFRRRFDLYGPSVHVHLESNLPRADLLRVAASLGVAGRRLPSVRRVGGVRVERLAPPEAAAVAWAQTPARLPAGYRAAAAYESRSHDARRTVTIVYRHPQAGFDDTGVRVTQARPVDVLPPSSETFRAVAVGGVDARWSAERGELEWIEDGVLRAVAAPSFGLDEAVRIAASLR